MESFELIRTHFLFPPQEYQIQVKADIRNPLRYLLITEWLLRSLSGVACTTPDTSKSPPTAYCFSQWKQGTYLIRLKSFSALYATLYKKRTRQCSVAPSGSFRHFDLLFCSAFVCPYDSCSFKSSATKTPALKPISIISSISAS